MKTIFFFFWLRKHCNSMMKYDHEEFEFYFFKNMLTTFEDTAI